MSISKSTQHPTNKKPHECGAWLRLKWEVFSHSSSSDCVSLGFVFSFCILKYMKPAIRTTVITIASVGIFILSPYPNLPNIPQTKNPEPQPVSQIVSRFCKRNRIFWFIPVVWWKYNEKEKPCFYRALSSLPRAEREGFEPPIHASVYCISSAAHSARLCHLSIISGIFRRKLSCPLRNHNAQNWKNTWKLYLNYTRKMNMKSWWKVLFPIIASGNSRLGKKNPLNYFTRS